MNDSGAQFVSFGKDIAINTQARLNRFDNGASKAYQAFDKNNAAKKYIALVAGVESLPRWTGITAYDALSDTSFMRMIGNGIVNWAPENQQKYVFLYDGNVGDCLLPEGQINDLNWRHPEIVEFLVQPVARLLREMQDKNFNHGSIRPSNIFHSSADKRGQIILGDCLSVQSGSSQPEIFMSIQRACCDPMGRGNGSVSDDLYAFGVTLAMFLRKNDELEKLSNEELLRRKIEFGSYATFVGKERFPAVFLEILRGVLHDNPAQRWTLDELFLWLDGTRMNPPALMKRKKANRPLVFNNHKYLYADMLALDLDKNVSELAVMVEDGSLGQWVEKSSSDPLTFDRYEKVVERIASMGGVSVNRDFLAAEMRMAFFPMLPIKYKGRVFNYDGMGNMMASFCYQEKDMGIFKDVLSLNIVDHSLGFKDLQQNEMITWFRLYDNCRVAIRGKAKIGFGVEKCIYLLAKNAPCMSPLFKGCFVNGHRVALVVYEKMSEKAGQIALFMDHHSVAFFSAHNPNEMDRAIYDLDSEDKIRKVIGNLKYLAVMQVKASNLPVPAAAKVFLDAMSGIYDQFKNKKLKKQIEKNVVAAAAAGDLVSMLALIENHVVLKKDKNAFAIARKEYMLLQNEYNEYNKRLSSKSTYGVSNGHDVAALIAWMISTAISMLVVFAFISGYRIF